MIPAFPLHLASLLAFGLAQAPAPATQTAPAPAGPVAQSADASELTRLETVWNEAHVQGDAGALDRLWADELVVAVPRMPALDKAGGLAMWRSGRMKFQKYETAGLQVRVYGESAVVTGSLKRARVREGQVLEDDWLFTKVYVRRDGRWQVVAFHASETGR